MMEKIPVLYTCKNSNYNFLDVDCYDQVRNAFSYNGNSPVIAHPPCRLFSKLKAFSNAPACEKLMAYSAIATIRANGGVLEHPAGSSLFKEMNIPLDGSVDEFGGYVRRVYMKDFGACYSKNTLIYIVGCPPGSLPAYPLSFILPTKNISSSKRRKLGEVPKSMREVSPIMFCKYLISICIQVKNNRL